MIFIGLIFAGPSGIVENLFGLDFQQLPRVLAKFSCRKKQSLIYVLCLNRFSCCHSSGPEVIKLFSCSTQLNMNVFLLINIKMPTIVGILTFMSGKNSILGLPEPNKAEFLDIFILMSI